MIKYIRRKIMEWINSKKEMCANYSYLTGGKSKEKE